MKPSNSSKEETSEDASWSWLRPFQRITTSKSYVPQIDGLRFIAIFVVIAYHVRGTYLAKQGVALAPEVANDAWLQFINSWNWGVQLFFVISGYVLGKPFCEEATTGRAWQLKKYYIRRLTRIEPPLVINLIIVFLSLIVLKQASGTALAPHLLASMTYSHGLIYHGMSTINYVTWSLELEAQFYLLAPLLALPYLLKSKPIRWAIWLTLILSFGTCARFIDGHPGWLYYTILRHGQFFVAGFLCADIITHVNLEKNRVSWDAVGFGSLAMFQWIWISHHGLTHWLAPFLLAGVLLASLNGRLLAAITGWPLLATVGGMCYTLYLYHPILKSTLGKLTFSWSFTNSIAVDTTLQIILHFIFIVLVGGVLFLLFEKPFMRKDWPLKLVNWIKS
jgi:peptidoglycan/LPS O-acetylase OafA/YrhL